MSFQRGLIDLNNYEEKDLIIKNIQHGILALQVEGTASVSISGKQSALDNYVDLCVINLSDFTKTDSISNEGAYICAINGLDEIKFEVSGSGKINWKELGE